VIGFSSAQFLLVLAVYLLSGALLGAVPGLLLTVLLHQPRRSARWDAAIGVCGILVGLAVSGWAGMHVSFLNGHGLGVRGFLAERGLILASCLTVVVVGARHARLRSENFVTQYFN
jgi:hypothetical protein